jgi:hypothetical protein
LKTRTLLSLAVLASVSAASVAYAGGCDWCANGAQLTGTVQPIIERVAVTAVTLPSGETDTLRWRRESARGVRQAG